MPPDGCPGAFCVTGHRSGRQNGYGAQQIELGFLVGGASDAEPLQHILLLAALQVAQLEQACTDGVGGAVILLRLLDGPAQPQLAGLRAHWRVP